MTVGEPPEQGHEGRWSPFPVQDWSTMPVTDGGPLRSEVVPPVEPPPSAPQRSGSFRTIMVLLCVVLVGTGIGLSDRIGGDPVAAGVVSFVPEDGTATVTAVRLSGSETAAYTQVTESARYGGAEGIGGLDFTLGSRVLAAEKDIERAPLWRTTTTRVDAVDATHQHVRVYRLDEGITLVAESGPDLGYVYRPALVEVPKGAVAGSRWTGHGTAGERLNYESELRAEAADPGCLRVRGTITYRTLQGRPLPTRTVQKTWCERQGIVRSADSVPGLTRTEEPLLSGVDHHDVSTVDKIITWSPSPVWASKTYNVITDDPQFGPGMMTAAAASVTPGLTASGRQIRVTSSSRDVVALRSESAGYWEALSRMHPGGTLLRSAVFGNVVVVTTSTRKVVAYTDRGVRLWAQELDDVVLTTPQRLTSTQVVVAAVDGQVAAFDLITGKRAWEISLGTDVAAAPAIGEGVVVIAGRDGQITVLGSADGHEITSFEVSQPEAVVVVNKTLVVRTEGYLEGFTLSTGDHRWRVVFGSIVDEIVTVGDLLVVAGREQTVAVAPDGQVRWRQHGFTDVVTDGTSLIGMGGGKAERLDSAGRILSGITIPANTATKTHRLVVSPNGFWLFGAGWGFTEYTYGR